MIREFSVEKRLLIDAFRVISDLEEFMREPSKYNATEHGVLQNNLFCLKKQIYHHLHDAEEMK
jgi:hypothetical protein